MSADLILFALLVGLVAGWQGRSAATAFVHRRRGSSGPVQVLVDTATQPAGGTGPELDLRDHVAYDQAADPGLELATCRLCRGRGRVWSIDGRKLDCLCGTPTRATASR